jgi:predicted nucleic acid-binding protein
MWLIHPVGWGICQTSRMLIFFEPAIEDLASLIVPSFSIYEVFKWILQQRSENFALQAVAAMEQGMVVEFSTSLSLSVARLSLEHKLPMADSVMLVTAQAYEATFWTQDSDFGGMAEVRYKAKKGSTG